ncbi:hypothetical protein TRFO_42952 [Tritrichomonas foetus]|uniref:CATSPERG C-terminal domain-containing protein n=1 Tax=Tritrichomonas foetus TaxID=1144522 RepID=A0A1J4KTL8_9EUKA|nr:hypothetical protein TRFO_42952 [Tritrichomonas foetus]|eukprot:OHT14607.1 hypothetical protein TRFO_42952 [Tritrichomonas foetus]
MIFEFLIFCVQSTFKFQYEPVDSTNVNNFWITPNSTRQFYFHLYEDDNRISDADEATLITSGINPIYFHMDADSAENAEIQSEYDMTGWKFSFRAKTPGTFCFLVRPNLDTYINIENSKLCFEVTSFFLENGQFFLGQLNLSNKVDQSVLGNVNAKSFRSIKSAALSKFATGIIEIENAVGSPYFTKNLTVISANDFKDIYYISYDFAEFPELISPVSEIIVEPDGKFFIQAGNSIILINNDQTYEVLNSNVLFSRVGCSKSHCSYMYQPASAALTTEATKLNHKNPSYLQSDNHNTKNNDNKETKEMNKKKSSFNDKNNREYVNNGITAGNDKIDRIKDISVLDEQENGGNRINFVNTYDFIQLEDNEEIIDATFSSKNYSHFIAVTKINEFYQIRTAQIEYNQIDTSLKQVEIHDFLHETPKSTVFYKNPQIIDKSVVFDENETIRPSVFGVHSHQHQEENIYIYGSDLVYSPSYGVGWFLLATFGEQNITDFTSSPVSSKYAFRTSEHKLYFGSVGSQFFNQIDLVFFLSDYYNTKNLETNSKSFSEDDVNSDTLYSSKKGNLMDGTNHDLSKWNNILGNMRLYYSNDDILYAILFNEDDGSIQRVPIPIEASQYTDSECPYFSCAILANDSNDITRVRDFQEFPSDIYLDHKTMYNFTVIFGKKAGVTPLFQVIANPILNINSSIVNDSLSDTLSYQVNITEQNTQPYKLLPGEYIETVPIVVRVSNTSPRCKFSQASISAHIGCPKGYVFENFPTGKLCDNDQEIQCLDYSQMWNPRFILRDSLDNSTTHYSGMFNLSIIGYGPSRDRMTMFANDDELYTYNFGSKPMWGFDASERTGIASHANSTVVWLCAQGSPCSNVSPSFPDVPKLYIKFHASTNISYDNVSYCIYDTTFDICLISLPLAFAYQILTISVTLAICIIISLFVYSIHLTHYSSSTLPNVQKQKKLSKIGLKQD